MQTNLSWSSYRNAGRQYVQCIIVRKMLGNPIKYFVKYIIVITHLDLMENAISLVGNNSVPWAVTRFLNQYWVWLSCNRHTAMYWTWSVGCQVYVACVRSHMSHIKLQKYIYEIKKIGKSGGGSVINGATLSSVIVIIQLDLMENAITLVGVTRFINQYWVWL